MGIARSTRHNRRMTNTRIAHFRTYVAIPSLAVALALLSGCEVFQPRAAKVAAPAEATVVALNEPQATHEFELAEGQDVVGVMQVTHASAEDTLSDIARRFNLGFDEIVRANPGVDPWLPGEGREIVLPTEFVLPNAPRDGLVINLPALRVFYFPKAKKGEPQRVITHPIGIGKVGWATPEGSTRIVSKRKNPVWTPPVSVREEHRKNGDPLPRQVPPGPDNPLGAFAMNLGWPSYLIHGTNKPYGVGMRTSHGCIRFYPEDIALLFDQIPVRTPVHAVNQPLLMGWRDGALYMQALPIMEDDPNPQSDGAEQILNAAISDAHWQKAKANGVAVDLLAVAQLAKERRGIATPVSRREVTPEKFLADAPRVINRIPDGATWDGREELLISAEEYEAVRDGKPLPKRPAEKLAAEPAKPPVKPTTAAPAGGGASTTGIVSGTTAGSR